MLAFAESCLSRRTSDFQQGRKAGVGVGKPWKPLVEAVGGRCVPERKAARCAAGVSLLGT